MSPLDRDEIIQFWDSTASSFDDGLVATHSPLPGRSVGEIEAWRSVHVPILGPGDSRVLDVGTATGNFALLLAHLGYRVVGVDGSEPMLVRARMKASQAGLDVAFTLGLAEELPFRDDTFDAVTNRLLMWTLLDPAAAVAEWRRVAIPGGRVVAVDRAHDQYRNLFDRARVAVLYLRTRGQDPSNYLANLDRRAQLPLWPIIDSSGYENAFVRGGLHMVRVSPVDEITRLERETRKWRHRLWPQQPSYLIEGIVPDVHCVDPGSPDPTRGEH